MAAKITATQVSKALTRCKFNPKQDAALGVVAELGDPTYIRTKCREILSGPTELKDSETRFLIQLLALRLVMISG